MNIKGLIEEVVKGGPGSGPQVGGGAAKEASAHAKEKTNAAHDADRRYDMAVAQHTVSGANQGNVDRAKAASVAAHAAAAEAHVNAAIKHHQEDHKVEDAYHTRMANGHRWVAER